MGTPVRGRHPRICRAGILDAAVEVLESNPGQPLSMAAVASVLGVTPMAIYRHYADKDDLLQALTDRLLADFRLDAPSGDPVLVLRRWAEAMRTYFLDRPYLIAMLVWEGGHVSTGWLRRGVIVFDAMRDLGLDGVQLGRATLWYWQVVMGAIQAELSERVMPYRLANDEFDSLPEEVKASVGMMLEIGSKPDHPEHFFTYQIDRALDALRLMLDDQGDAPSGTGIAGEMR